MKSHEFISEFGLKTFPCKPQKLQNSIDHKFLPPPSVPLTAKAGGCHLFPPSVPCPCREWGWCVTEVLLRLGWALSSRCSWQQWMQLERHREKFGVTLQDPSCVQPVFHCGFLYLVDTDIPALALRKTDCVELSLPIDFGGNSLCCAICTVSQDIPAKQMMFLPAPVPLHLLFWEQQLCFTRKEL